MFELDCFEEPLRVCSDPNCPWFALPDDRHLAKHNPVCAAWFIGTDGSEMLCELTAGHAPPHRGVIRHPGD